MTTPKTTPRKPTAVKVSTSPAKNEVATEETDDEQAVTVTVNVRGTEVSLDLPARFEDADPDAMVALEEGKITVAFKALIGARYWAQLKSLGWTATHFRSVVEEWQEQTGLGN